MQLVLFTFGRAVFTQLHPRMLLLTLAPFLLSLLVWAVVLWFGLQPVIDWLHAWFTDQQWFAAAGETLRWLGLGAVTVVLVPLVAMWLLLPLMIITALILVGALAMPVIVKHVSARFYPQLEMRGEGGFFGSVGTSLSSFALFVALWILTLPLALIPPLTFLIQPLLWGWLTYRVMSYDALADHATEPERIAIMRKHRLPLLAIGAATGALGALPTLLWLGGVFAVVLLPLVAAVAIWLYVMVFTLTGLWFEHYCLQALAAQRRQASGSPA